MLFPADVLGTEDPRYVTGAALHTLRRRVPDAIEGTVVRRRLELAGLDGDRVSSLTQLPQVQELVLGKEGQVAVVTEALRIAGRQGVGQKAGGHHHSVRSVRGTGRGYRSWASALVASTTRSTSFLSMRVSSGRNVSME